VLLLLLMVWLRLLLLLLLLLMWLGAGAEAGQVTLAKVDPVLDGECGCGRLRRLIGANTMGSGPLMAGELYLYSLVFPHEYLLFASVPLFLLRFFVIAAVSSYELC
jgi:hypothetical protein